MVIGFIYEAYKQYLSLTLIAYLCSMAIRRQEWDYNEQVADLLNGKRILELEAALIKSEAELQGYKDGDKAKSGTDYSKYIIMGIAAVEGLVLILERLA